MTRRRQMNMVKNIYKFVKENILQIKPIFKIRIEMSWFSKEYYCIKFSGNNGWTWKYLLSDSTLGIPSYPGKRGVEKLIVNARCVVHFAESFKTLKDCQKYNQTVMSMMLKKFMHYWEKVLKDIM